MKIQSTAVIAIASLSLAACGTITRGSNDTWVVETTPAGATVTTSNGYQCQSTPCGIRMPRRSEFVATITLDGYQTHESTVTYGASGAGGAAMAGNVIFGGLIGAGVDASTGAMNDIMPNPLQVTLRPVVAGAPTQTASEPAELDEPAPTEDNAEGDEIVARDEDVG